MTDRHIDIGTCRTFVRDRGHGPPILFGHSLTFDGDIWEAQISSLQDRFRTPTDDAKSCDRRNFSRSKGSSVSLILVPPWNPIGSVLCAQMIQLDPKGKCYAGDTPRRNTGVTLA